MFLPNRISQCNQEYDKYDFCLLRCFDNECLHLNTSRYFNGLWSLWFSNEKTDSVIQFQFYHTLNRLLYCYWVFIINDLSVTKYTEAIFTGHSKVWKTKEITLESVINTLSFLQFDSCQVGGGLQGFTKNRKELKVQIGCCTVVMGI